MSLDLKQAIASWGRMMVLKSSLSDIRHFLSVGQIEYCPTFAAKIDFEFRISKRAFTLSMSEEDPCKYVPKIIGSVSLSTSLWKFPVTDQSKSSGIPGSGIDGSGPTRDFDGSSKFSLGYPPSKSNQHTHLPLLPRWGKTAGPYLQQQWVLDFHGRRNAIASWHARSLSVRSCGNVKPTISRGAFALFPISQKNRSWHSIWLCM